MKIYNTEEQCRRQHSDHIEVFTQRGVMFVTSSGHPDFVTYRALGELIEYLQFLQSHQRGDYMEFNVTSRDPEQQS